ncbi:transmembrane protein 231-like isoform X1 [Acanthaster planci]|uniref:Transmembrane protein 231 n=1 Tax=Acanthaster planci TaxID=133434 RepID=A0A8B7YXJ9_ACAPL|nr:transmembrane protein 231-like isoform X1 [Acanthaster planci]
MAVLEIYSHPVDQRYKASLCSSATFFVIAAFLFTLFAPFIIVFWSEGLWLKTAFYREQPTVQFKHQMLLLVDTQDEASYLAWSTYQNFNQLQQQHLRIPLVKTREEDNNRDGKYDMLHFSVSVPVLATESVFGVKLILLFDYRLYRFSSLRMETMAYIEHTSPLSGSEFIADGELRLRLKMPLSHKALDTRYDTAVINGDSVFSSDYQLSKIFSDYISRNVSTYFECRYPVWQRGPSSSETFLIRGTVRYPEELLVYVPGFFQVMVWAWVQYLSSSSFSSTS